MVEHPTVQLPVRFAVIRGSARTVQAWLAGQLAPQELVSGPVTLAVWGPLYGTADGKAVGTLAGVVFNHVQMRRKIADRGLDAQNCDHPALAVHHVGSFGPRGLGDLRWQGSVALLHRAQGQALVARDLLGVGWLGWRRLDDGSDLLTNDPRMIGDDFALDPQQHAVPPGLAVAVDAQGTRGVRVDYAAENQAFLREIPDVLRQASAVESAAEAQHRLSAAVLACVDAHGGLSTLPELVPKFARDQMDLCGDGPAQWTLAGLGDVPPDDAEILPSREGPWTDPGPAEPIDRVAPDELRRRLWRHRALPDGAMRRAQAEALATGRCLVAPHLDPAVLAWVEAVRVTRGRDADLAASARSSS